LFQHVVQTANAVFLQAGLSLRPDYDAALKKYYNSSVDEVDFENGGPVARSIINRWVAKQTDGHISKLLETPLPGHTRLLLVNALALRALWNNSFDPSLTVSNGHFHPNSKSR
jgi:serpin B